MNDVASYFNAQIGGASFPGALEGSIYYITLHSYYMDWVISGHLFFYF